MTLSKFSRRLLISADASLATNRTRLLSSMWPCFNFTLNRCLTWKPSNRAVFKNVARPCWSSSTALTLMTSYQPKWGTPPPSLSTWWTSYWTKTLSSKFSTSAKCRSHRAEPSEKWRKRCWPQMRTVLLKSLKRKRNAAWSKKRSISKECSWTSWPGEISLNKIN